MNRSHDMQHLGFIIWNTDVHKDYILYSMYSRKIRTLCGNYCKGRCGMQRRHCKHFNYFHFHPDLTETKPVVILYII